MKIILTKKFNKQISKLKDKKLAMAVQNTILTTKKAGSIEEIASLKKMQGEDKRAYRIRIGDHIIGVHIENDTITFDAFAHRKDIYKTFP